MVQYLGLWILIALAFNMWTLISVLRSGTRLTGRLVWVLVLVCLPGLGFLAWYLLGPRQQIS